MKYLIKIKCDTICFCDIATKFIHRLNGTAIINSFGEFWHSYCELHRKDDPAIIYKTGHMRWFEYGREIFIK